MSWPQMKDDQPAQSWAHFQAGSSHLHGWTTQRATSHKSSSSCRSPQAAQDGQSALLRAGETPARLALQRWHAHQGRVVLAQRGGLLQRWQPQTLAAGLDCGRAARSLVQQKAMPQPPGMSRMQAA